MTTSGQQNVQLAVAGDMIEESEPVDHTCNKAGGKPVFAGSEPPLDSSELVCQVCAKPLSLIVQVRNRRFTFA